MHIKDDMKFCKAMSVKGGVHYNSCLFYLVQHYEEQIINKNERRKSLKSRKTSLIQIIAKLQGVSP